MQTFTLETELHTVKICIISVSVEENIQEITEASVSSFIINIIVINYEAFKRASRPFLTLRN